MVNYDNYKTGLYDSESPMNREYEEQEEQNQQLLINNLKDYHKEINALEETKNAFGLTSDQDQRLKNLIFLRNRTIKRL